ncbi:MAG: c-type cytochrome domain-containing protein [Verrucomicrobiota bacterium]|nr:c-type cytochrome domain-containing protein [Verrucomicrobiota bacterium]
MPSKNQYGLAPTSPAGLNAATRMRHPGLKSASVCLAKLALAIAAAWPDTGRAEAGGGALAKRAMHLLRDHCVRCHNAKKNKGGLNLATRALALKGGSEGPALLPGQAAKSRMIRFLPPDSDPHMPPKKQLNADQIAALSQWIAAGAEWLPGELAIEAKHLDPGALGQLPGGYRPVFALALSPDNRRLAAGHGNLVAVHNLADKDQPFPVKLTGHRDAIQSVAWSPDGLRLATGGFRRVLLWNGANWSPGGELTDLPGRVTAMAFTPDNATLITASNAPGQAAEITLWNVDDFAKRLAWRAHDEAVFDLAIAPSGKTLASAGADKQVRFWSLEKGVPLMQIEAHTAPVLSLAYKPDGTLLASGGADKELKIWDTKTREQKNLVTGHPGNVAAIAWPEKKAELITASDDGALRLCSETGTRPDKTWAKAADLLHCLDATTDGKLLYGGADNGRVYAWNRNGKIIRTLEPPAP